MNPVLTIAVIPRVDTPVMLCPILQPPAIDAPVPITAPPPNWRTSRRGSGALRIASPAALAARNAPTGTATTINDATLMPEASPLTTKRVNATVGWVKDKPKLRPCIADNNHAANARTPITVPERCQLHPIRNRFFGARTSHTIASAAAAPSTSHLITALSTPNTPKSVA